MPELMPELLVNLSNLYLVFVDVVCSVGSCIGIWHAFSMRLVCAQHAFGMCSAGVWYAFIMRLACV